MDAYQQPHRYARPPPPPPPQGPPSTSDPHYHYYHHQQQQTRPPLPPPQGPAWYSNQFQYPHHPPSSHSPSPPPPPHHQWGAPPPPPAAALHSDHFSQSHSSSYPPHHVPYPAHPHQPAFHGNNNNTSSQFPPPPRPPLPPQSQIPQPYPQEWSSPSWGHHQGWDYPALNNVEDWGARAREWAAAKAAMEDQRPQSQFTPVGRPEEQNRFHDQHPQSVDSHCLDVQQQSLPASSYQHVPVPAAPQHQQPLVYPQDTASVSSGGSYVPDEHLRYSVRDGSLAGDSNAGFSHQESLPATNSFVHQQEVSSSYSSVTGKEEIGERKEQTYKSVPLPISSGQEGQHQQPSLPAAGRSTFIEQPYAYSNQAADVTSNLSDQPLDFAPRFNPDHGPHMQSSYAIHHESMGAVRGIDPVAGVPPVNSWTPPAGPSVVYPPIPPAITSGPQNDPSIPVPSPVSGHAPPPFARFPGSSFQPTIPSAVAPFGLSPGPVLHPTAAFPVDTYGVSSASERPKKASVPNWLKEEIIKNKAAITKSSLDHPREGTQSIDDEGVDNSFGKGDRADSKSLDSSRSNEEEDDDDDEDYVEAARTAAINQEIKRVLTEVLLKVTDELFDEIASKVLSEDDLTVEDDRDAISLNHNVSSPPQAVSANKAAAKILVPVKAKEPETEGVTEKSSSSSPGDVLGLANYASDDDDDDDDDGSGGGVGVGVGNIQSSSVTNSRNNALQSRVKKLSEAVHDAAENGSSKAEVKEHHNVEVNMDTDLSKTSVSEPHDDKSRQHAYSSKVASGDKEDEGNADSGKVLDRTNDSESNDSFENKLIMKAELLGGIVHGKKSTINNFQGKEKLDKNGLHESKRSSGKEFGKEVDSRSRADENRGKEDDRYLRKEKRDDRNSSKEGPRDEGVKPGDKSKESESRKKSTHPDVKDDRKDRIYKTSAKEDADRKRERTKEEDRSRHKHSSDSGRHKRRRSSSIGSRGRNSKDNSTSHAAGSSDEASDDSKRKRHPRKRNLSPSPVRSRRRQVSRSPHSKHSQRRHSPYYSLEATRGRRSRSRSPLHRQR